VADDPLSVECPACSAPPFAKCRTPTGKEYERPHHHRHVAISKHPAKLVTCPSCGAEPGFLCLHLARKNVRNVGFHDARDHQAEAAGVGQPVTGLYFPNGTQVRDLWVEAARVRKEDGLKSFKVRMVGSTNLYLWASSFDGEVWCGDLFKDKSQRAAVRRRKSIVDAVGDLSRKGTFWSEDVLEKYKEHGSTFEEDEGEAPADWGDCDHSPCTGH
jgi:hypothetical protein